MSSWRCCGSWLTGAARWARTHTRMISQLHGLRWSSFRAGR
ncbi:MAG TPA: hypothetical protein VLW44_18650 [Streptosporangiaceae bacterium]|nr:hypothetical protein [Streptosporangiaceae bacterium]